ncbi:MAG TPA: DUF2796 domain-containing protein [Burkholderiales bacterium]|jgi:hypothetical protein|nr:DUF2796 domain-containing protein [Burkholderiales bacterium]
MTRFTRLDICLGMVVLAAGSVAYGADAHVHGAARLEVAVDGKNVTMELLSPLDSVVGFEHAPRTEKQKVVARNALEQLRKADAMFTLTPEARCAVTSVNLDAPALAAQQASGKKASEHKDGDHAELSAEYSFVCEQPDSLRGLEVKLFDNFSKLRRLDVEVVGPKGQTAAKLSPSKRRVVW